MDPGAAGSTGSAVSIANQHFENLKFILENVRAPERLDNHPWTQSLLVQDALERNPLLVNKSPGQQLLLVIGELFRGMIPATPPKKGKRLDTRWGRFGILAANYFAPLLYGRLYPVSLREAWRRIDQAVLLFAFGDIQDELKPEQVEPYQLVGEELDMAANSTISDWHRSGLEELADLLVSREKHLSQMRAEPSPILDAEIMVHSREKNARSSHPNPRRNLLWRWGLLLFALFLLGMIVAGALKARRMLNMVETIQGDIVTLQSLDLTSLEPATLEQVGPLLKQTKQDILGLQDEVAPWLWLTSRLTWVPVYGGDIKNVSNLLDLASSLLDVADITYQTAFPIWQAFYQQEQNIKLAKLTGQFLDAQPSLLEAQKQLHQALLLRQSISLEELSPPTQSLVMRLDPYLAQLDEALSLALELPGLLGGAQDGPKTYLILVQNEDELRPTGGFITSVGKVLVHNGELISWSVEDSYTVDDIDKIYPIAPWQMRNFMNIPIFVFRDASWYTNYPTAVAWAEYLYAYTNAQSVDGVIAIDQQVLISILSVIGPVYVEEIDTTITSENVLEVMRAQKIPPPSEEIDSDWHRKQFMQPIASTILDRLLEGEGFSWEHMLRALLADLDQHHILVQLDDPVLTEVLAKRSWDGAVRYNSGDFLMVVDTNVGYNKTNAVASSRFSYDVDLTDLSVPISNLVVFHKNNAQADFGEECEQNPSGLGLDQSTLEFWYPIDRCYYNYLRIYVPGGTQLVNATPHQVTRDDMIMLAQDVPARVDLLDEKIENVQGFGTLMVVPMEGSLNTSFQFNLPPKVLIPGLIEGEMVYHLKIQKQPGVVSMPVTVRVHLPTSSEVVSISPPVAEEVSNILFDLELRENIEIEIIFRP